MEDLEEVLLQVMVDEFEVVVDDGSAGEVAGRIWRGWEGVLKGELTEVQAMHALWLERREKGEKLELDFRRGEDEEGVETDGESEEEGDEEEEWGGFPDGDRDGDQEMGEAPALVRKKEKERVEPEVDEDGFTKVVGKKKR